MFDDFVEKLLDCWWGQILVGLGFVGLAYFFYGYFTDLETNGGIRRMPCWFAAIYWITGKWGTVVLTAIPGLLAIGIGIRNFMGLFTGREDD